MAGNGDNPSVDSAAAQPQSSLATEAARQLATTTKSEPQTQGTSPRWLLRKLPWVQTGGGVYRLNRRLTYTVGDGQVSFVTTGAQVRVIPRELCELPALRGFDDDDVLGALAERFVQREVARGEVIAELGAPADEVFLLAHGKAEKIGRGKYGEDVVWDVLSGGDHFGDLGDASGDAAAEPGGEAPRPAWGYTFRAVTRCTVLALPRTSVDELAARSDALRAHLAASRAGAGGGADRGTDKYGQAAVAIAAGHSGEPALAGTFVDYDVSPREYELSVAQTVLRVHTRVVDLFSEPMNQFEQQLRLTIEALRERQEYELINNREFGLLHNADLAQRIYSRTGPPTPDDVDELLCRRRSPRMLLAHPRAIAAFGRECSRRGLYAQTTTVDGAVVTTWRGVPMYPCDKIPVTADQTSSILVLRTGEHDQGVIGLHQTGIPDEYEPGLSVRFMNVDDKAIISYLVSLYYSAAVLVPDALGILEDVEVGR